MTFARVCVLLLAVAGSLRAQDADLSVHPPTDSALARARQLVLADKGDEGRKLIDSVMKAAGDSDQTLYGEALFWRGALAATAADAERSYRRLLIEAPLHARAEDALLQLAQLEAARGDRKSASDHLYRYMVTYGPSDDRPARPRVSLWLVKLLFDQNQLTKGCDAVRMSDQAIPQQNVEMHNQLDAYAQRCTYAEADTAAPDTTADVKADAKDKKADAKADKKVDKKAVAKADRKAEAKTDTESDRKADAKADTRSDTRAAKGTPKVFYSVQVAAYDSREAAAHMTDLLVGRGLDARVDGTSRPFRVRIGRFATRAEAVRLAQTLKSQGQNGFVTMVSPR